MQTTMALYLNSTQNKAKGNKNNNTPVHLFKRVCSTTSLFLCINPNITFATFIPAIKIIQIHKTMGTSTAYKILINKIVTNIKSAIVSNFAQKLLVELVMRKIIQTKTSNSPQIT